MSEINKNLLLIAWAFPPHPKVAAVRSWNIAKHLSRLGWTVTVLTPQPSGEFDETTLLDVEKACRREGIERLFAGKIIGRPFHTPVEKPRRWLRYGAVGGVNLALRCLVRLNAWSLWPVAWLGSTPAFAAGRFAVVLATGGPFLGSFRLAYRIAKRLDIPFVLDYRDPWSLNSMVRNHLFASRMERGLLRNAAAITMVSPSQAVAQSEKFAMARQPVVITNGFDPEDLEAVKPEPKSPFSVVYAGLNFYPGNREIDPLLEAVKKAHAVNAHIRLHVYGEGKRYIMRRAKAHNAEHVVVCHGRVPRAQALAAIKGADVVAVIAGIKDRAPLVERGIITGKIFEPLGMGIPILLVAPEGSDATAIVEASAAGCSFKGSQTDEMAHWLVELANGKINYPYQPPAAYSWPVLARQFDTLLASCQT